MVIYDLLRVVNNSLPPVEGRKWPFTLSGGWYASFLRPARRRTSLHFAEIHITGNVQVGLC
jgi:hypothetical protein